jgi:hypothetical protein
MRSIIDFIRGGSSSPGDTEDESSSPIGTKAPIAIYNQAYQENFETDTIDEIIDTKTSQREPYKNLI